MEGRQDKEENKLMEKLYCENCDEFKDQVSRSEDGTGYYEWNGQDYEWYDSGESSPGDYWYCQECGEELTWKDFRNNKWQGGEKK